jgi:hypothetical protein
MTEEIEVDIRWDGDAWLIKTEKTQIAGESFETLSKALQLALGLVKK